MHVVQFFRNLANDIIQPFKQNTIYALVGASGTGKSYNAKFVAAQYGLRAIIDDGLLIQADKILAGHSAKNEKSFLAAVRVALFDDKEHRDDIARAIKRYRIRKILILGTSEKMVMRIAARLQLPPPTRIIHIEEMVSKEKIELALKSRQIEGKHVIPVSSNEVRKRYPKIFANGIRFTFHRLTPTQLLAKNNKVVEKSIVQPSFSIQSRRTISEAAIVRMAMLCVGSYDKTICVKKILIIADARGYKLTITMNILPDTQLPLTKRVDNLQKQIINNIESTSGIFIENVNIVIDKVIESR